MSFLHHDAENRLLSLANLVDGKKKESAEMHLFLPRRPRRLKRREKSRPVKKKKKGRWWAFGKVGPVGCLHSSDDTEKERNEERGRETGKRVESTGLDDREKQTTGYEVT
ncbi:Ribosomal protein S3 [Heracleum sosnowskyi]|uniref:Ribosomal protein S3 n=1 Tax=Heracleum sosnowskyi TaxID=360622 RepID=A0AAD8NA76_9APIA|nr:Ribosomal protein S3 [Heracleum sosnowskyi]